MPVVESYIDSDALTLTVVSEHDAEIDRVWQLWENPRLLEAMGQIDEVLAAE